MKILQIVIILYCLMFISNQALAQFIGFTGHIIDYVTGQPIAGAEIKLVNFPTTKATVSNQDGYYQLAVPTAGTYNIYVQAENYERAIASYQESNTIVDIELLPANPTLEQQAIIEYKWQNEKTEGCELPKETEISLAIITAPIDHIPATIRVLFDQNQPPRTMFFEEYLKGVVIAEIGGASLEALKAQAIASRTYALFHLSERRHKDADVCIKTHCQAWKKIDNNPLIEKAVNETNSQVIRYRGGIINALYFAHCEGRTRASGGSTNFPEYLPYLISVPCMCGVDFSVAKELQQDLINFNDPVARARIKNEIVKHYPNIGDLYLKEYTTGMWLIYDTELKMGFRFMLMDDRIDVYKIFGHLIGMCQSGAGKMAKKGATCEEILHHYYTNIEIVKLPNESIATSTKFQSTDYVRTTAELRMRKTQEIRDDNINTVLAKNIFLQIAPYPDNGIFASGHYWWRIGDNWCAEEYLELLFGKEKTNLRGLIQFSNYQEMMKLDLMENADNYYYLSFKSENLEVTKNLSERELVFFKDQNRDFQFAVILERHEGSQLPSTFYTLSNLNQMPVLNSYPNFSVSGSNLSASIVLLLPKEFDYSSIQMPSNGQMWQGWWEAKIQPKQVEAGIWCAMYVVWFAKDQLSLPQINLIEGSNSIGTQINDNISFFSKTGSVLNETQFSLNCNSENKINIFDLSPNISYTVFDNEVSIYTAAANEYGSLTFPLASAGQHNIKLTLTQIGQTMGQPGRPIHKDP